MKEIALAYIRVRDCWINIGVIYTRALNRTTIQQHFKHGDVKNASYELKVIKSGC